jgi:catechol 2,3-dioxygenase-like lactoylglutathione lyase family enzyme
MAIEAIDHVNVRCAHMEKSIAFYGTILGMKVEPAPGQSDLRENAWVIARDGRPVVHLNLAKPDADFLNEQRDWSGLKGSGRVHHVAFECSDHEGMRRTLSEAGLSLRFNDVVEIGLRQIFAHDPDGILVELNFR